MYANEDFKMVRALDPNNEHALRNLAVYSFRRQLWKDSHDAFTRLIHINPEDAESYVYRARVNAYLGEWEEAYEVSEFAMMVAGSDKR